MHDPRRLFAAALFMTLSAVASPGWAQRLYDDHELTDRFSIAVGGFSQNDIRTTLRLDAKTPAAGIALGTVISLESLFDVDDQVTTVRLDGWYRFGKKNRINWTYWQTDRKGVSTYTDTQPIEIGDTIIINTGDNVVIDDKTRFYAVSWSYSFLNIGKAEAWLGAGLNFQSIDAKINVTLSGATTMLEETAKGTVPLPTLNFGFRWNFSKRTRALFNQELLGLRVGDYSGKLEDTRLHVEYNIIKNFSIGGGLERRNFEVNADNEDFLGEFDTGYTGFMLYVKGLS